MKWNRLVLSTTGFCLLHLVSACGTSGPPVTGTGGTSAMSGGANGLGGGAPVGGSLTSTGGTNSGAGGTNAGGLPGSGSTSGTGGSDVNAGGTSTGGGATETGGANAGGSTGDGGGTSTGGNGTGGAPPVERPGLVTSGRDEFWKVGTLTAGTGTATVRVNASQTYQKWIGFGGTFNEQGWDALGVLSEADRSRAIRLLFSASEGANFKWGRMPIGASDYAVERYTLNENAGDYEMTMFSIERDKMRLIPYIQAALAVKPDINIWGSPWTPPSWFKTPARIDGLVDGVTGEATMNGTDQNLAAYAKYFVRYVQEYAKEGITIHSVHPQNEPGYASRYPSCLWTNDHSKLARFVGDFLAPAFAEEQITTEIWFGTLSNGNESAAFISGLTGNSKALAAVKGAGLQWNTRKHVKELANRGLMVMQTEHKCGNYPFSQDYTAAPQFDANKPQNDYAYGIESWTYLRDWIREGVNAYSAWNMVLDTFGKNLDPVRPWPQNALLVVDRTAKTLTATPAYYVFRHLSAFVDPNATRIDATGEALAFKNPDNSLVAVIYNTANATSQVTVAIGTGTYQVSIPAQGWATVYVKS
jgi:glucosylceramidase